MILEGALRIYWGVRGVIHLKEDDDQRTVVTARNRNSCRRSVSDVRIFLCKKEKIYIYVYIYLYEYKYIKYFIAIL